MRGTIFFSVFSILLAHKTALGTFISKMVSKKKLPHSRRCQHPEKLAFYCYCVSQSPENGHKPCKELCHTAEDYPDRPGKRASKTEVVVYRTGSGDGESGSDTAPETEVEIEIEGIEHTRYKREFPPHDNHVPNNQFKGPTFTCLDVFMGLWSIGFFYFDMITDILLARDYYHQDDKWAFALTATFIIGPSLITLILNIRWYYLDFQSQDNLVKKFGAETIKQTSALLWITRFFMSMFLMGPVIRQIEYIYNGVKSSSKHLPEKEKQRHYRLMRMEDVDACCIRMFECFLEAAPQLVLQIFLLITHRQNHEEETWIIEGIRAAAIMSSWLSLSWSMVAYQKALRFSHEDKENMTIPGMIFSFLWRACEIGPRVIALGMFAAQFKHVVFFVVGAHWIVMSSWLFCQKTQFYKNRCEEKFFNIVCGYVLVFCFLNVRDGRTRYRMLVFYFIMYAENWTMMGFWFYFTDNKSEWFYLPSFFVVALSVFLQQFFQLTYYKCFHPLGRGKIKCCPDDTSAFMCYESLCHDLQPEEEEYQIENPHTTARV